VVAGTTAGTVVMADATGLRSTTGGCGLGPALGVMRGQVTYKGVAGHRWGVFTASGLTVNLTGPGTAMTLNLTYTNLYPDTTNTGTFSAAGTSPLEFYGGVCNVGANQAPGAYTGSWTMQLQDQTNGQTATQTATISITIVAPITLTQLTGLRFGDAFRSATAGTVVITPAGARTAIGGVTLGTLLPTGAATFTVTGTPSGSFGVTLPTSVTLTGPASATMTATTFTSSPSGTGTLSTAGTLPLAVGATLNVAANQTPGDYAGTFAVTVTYN
jgi:hypothetical protein